MPTNLFSLRLGNDWSQRVNGIVFFSPQHRMVDYEATEAPADFISFLSKRCRAYMVAPSSVETPVSGKDELGCNCYASGEKFYPENALFRCWRHVLDWFDMIYANPTYEEVEFEIKREDDESNLGW
jgi:hypothetical protein